MLRVSCSAWVLRSKAALEVPTPWPAGAAADVSGRSEPEPQCEDSRSAVEALKTLPDQALTMLVQAL